MLGSLDLELEGSEPESLGGEEEEGGGFDFWPLLAGWEGAIVCRHRSWDDDVVVPYYRLLLAIHLGLFCLPDMAA